MKKKDLKKLGGLKKDDNIKEETIKETKNLKKKTKKSQIKDFGQTGVLEAIMCSGILILMKKTGDKKNGLTITFIKNMNWNTFSVQEIEAILKDAEKIYDRYLKRNEA